MGGMETLGERRRTVGPRGAELAAVGARDDLTVVRVDSGHWWPASRPAAFAELLRGNRVSR
ncbi:MAG: hypothetical protein ABWX69_08225 [Arthrobacter sp.]